MTGLAVTTWLALFGAAVVVVAVLAVAISLGIEQETRPTRPAPAGPAQATDPGTDPWDLCILFALS